MHNGIDRQPNLSALLALMWDVLRKQGTVTLAAASDLPADLYGETVFDTNRVAFRPDLTLTEFAETFAHEMLHVLRGPALVEDEDAEEDRVERQALDLLYGSDVVATDQDRRKAAALVAAVNPPSLPRLVVLQGGAR